MIVVQFIFSRPGIQVARHWWQAVSTQNALHTLSILLKKSSQSMLLPLLLDSGELLFACLANLENIFLGSRLATHTKQTNNIRLVDVADPGVVPSNITLPIRVVRDVSCRNGNRVVVRQRGQSPRGRKAILGVQGDTSRTVRVHGKQATNTFPYSG